MLNVMGVINVRNQKEVLEELTVKRCIASVPFGGRYRLIDFVLSSMVNSGIFNVGIFTLKKSRSLMDHLGTGKDWDLNRKKDGLFILPPEYTCSPEVFTGELQNLYYHLDYFNKSKQEYVLIAAGNMICNIDFHEAYKFHLEKGADITLLYRMKNTAGVEDFFRGRKVKLAEDGKVLDIEETPGSRDFEKGKTLLKCFIMKKSLFMEMIEYCVKEKRCSLVRDGIIGNLNRLKIYGYPYDGYLAVINSLPVYYKYSMELLKPEVWSDLFFRPGLIFTKVKDEPPTRYLRGSRVNNSLLANGCLIEGTVENSIIFRGVKVQKGAVIKDSIVMQKSHIEENSFLENAILDKDVLVTRDKEIKGDKEEPVVISKNMVV